MFTFRPLAYERLCGRREPGLLFLLCGRPFWLPGGAWRDLWFSLLFWRPRIAPRRFAFGQPIWLVWKGPQSRLPNVPPVSGLRGLHESAWWMASCADAFVRLHRRARR